MAMKEYPLEFPKGQHGNCRTLTELTAEHLPRNGSSGRVRRYRLNADVWQPDDRQDRLYFLQSGQVAVMVGDAEGREIILRLIEPGEPFGELCFCGKHKQRETFARAVAPSEAIEVDIADFMSYLQSDHNVLAAFVFTFCIRLSDAERRIEFLAYRGAEERLGRLLLHLAATSGAIGEEPEAEEEAKLNVSHDDLAQMAAMSRPQVTLTLNNFRRRKLVHYERGRPLVVHVSALRAYLTGEHEL